MSLDLSKLAGKSPEELIAIIAAMSKAGTSRLTCKVSEKGAMSLYGMGRWPVTLYKSQWRRLLLEADAIEAFLKAHDSVLVDKAPAE